MCKNASVRDEYARKLLVGDEGASKLCGQDEWKSELSVRNESKSERSVQDKCKSELSLWDECVQVSSVYKQVQCTAFSVQSTEMSVRCKIASKCAYEMTVGRDKKTAMFTAEKDRQIRCLIDDFLILFFVKNGQLYAVFCSY